MRKYLVLFGKITAAMLAAFIVVEAAGFFAVKYGISDVQGEIDANSNQYNDLAKKIKDSLSERPRLVRDTATATNGLPETLSVYGPNAAESWCKVKTALDHDSLAGKSVYDAYRQTRSEVLLGNMLLAMKLRLRDGESFAADLEACRNAEKIVDPLALHSGFDPAATSSIFVWQNSEPWQIIHDALIKDKDRIKEAAEKAGVQPRMLVSVAIVEQLRLYYTQRELFEKIFKPLRILANANKMAWGVMSIKEKMAIDTEKHLQAEKSPYYIGSSTEHLLDFPAGADADKVRYERLTDEKNHYYSFLYGALIIKQFETQWAKAGFPLEYRPEIVSTLFNIGFKNSKPKADPEVGGSTIEIEGEKYFFGSLAYEFYYSGAMMEEFPFE